MSSSSLEIGSVKGERQRCPVGSLFYPPAECQPHKALTGHSTRHSRGVLPCETLRSTVDRYLYIRRSGTFIYNREGASNSARNRQSDRTGNQSQFIQSVHIPPSPPHTANGLYCWPDHVIDIGTCLPARPDNSVEFFASSLYERLPTYHYDFKSELRPSLLPPKTQKPYKIRRLHLLLRMHPIRSRANGVRELARGGMR